MQGAGAQDTVPEWCNKHVGFGCKLLPLYSWGYFFSQMPSQGNLPLQLLQLDSMTHSPRLGLESAFILHLPQGRKVILMLLWLRLPCCCLIYAITAVPARQATPSPIHSQWTHKDISMFNNYGSSHFASILCSCASHTTWAYKSWPRTCILHPVLIPALAFFAQ